uniref:adenylate kinase n=1 Tax=Araucaria cunninghamii TaxID=56994 RepID=A0A0D6QTU7_ARACU
MAWCVSSPCPSKYTLAHTPRHCSAILVQHQQPAHLCRSCNKLESYHSHFEDEIRLTLKRGLKRRILRPSSTTLVCAETKANQRPLKLIISGAPASGKGTQCELIVKKYGLVHISTGDLLRSEVAAGSANGKKAKEFMEKGALVPDEIVVSMVKRRLAQQDAQEKGWLLDGYPRSLPQAQVFESLEIKPDIFLVLDVPDEILIERVVGRRLDPITGKIYHLKYLPPETEEIAARLTQRFDDTEEKARSRLQTHQQNIEAVLSVYKNIMKTVNGNHPKEEVFKEIDTILVKMLEGGPKDVGFPVGMNDVPTKDAVMDDRTFRSTNNWKGIPTKLNNIPHSREIREYFYEDVRRATIRAVEDGMTRLKVEINIPELNPNMDVYRIGTLMELVRVIALTFADDGKRVKVCVQGSMGEGVLAGMPLQLAGTRKILEFMDWGEYDAKGTFINIGSIGAKEVNDQDNMFILVAPQNAMGNCIIDDLQAMVEAAGSRPMILVNPRLKDLPSAGGIMQTIGREERMEFAASFLTCYSFRLLYKVGTQYPIVGALRMSYPYAYELYKRIDTEPGKEEYVRIATFTKNPTSEEINDTFSGKSRKKELESTGLWGFLSAIF